MEMGTTLEMCAKVVAIKAVRPTKGPRDPFDARDEKGGFAGSKSYVFHIEAEVWYWVSIMLFHPKKERVFCHEWWLVSCSWRHPSKGWKLLPKSL